MPVSVLAADAAKKADIASFFLAEAPVSSCVAASKDCDTELVIEKSFKVTESIWVAPGISLRSDSQVRAWYLGSQSGPAQAIRARGGAFKDVCSAAEGGCIVLYADGELDLPGGSKLSARLGDFVHLSSLDFGRDTPGILRAAKGTRRTLHSQVRGTLNVAGLPLNVVSAKLKERPDGVFLHGIVGLKALDRGRLTTDVGVGSGGQWLLKGRRFVLEHGGLGPFSLARLELEAGDPRGTWQAQVDVSAPGLARLHGVLRIKDGRFEAIDLKVKSDDSVAKSGLLLRCLNGAVLRDAGGVHISGWVGLSAGKSRAGSERLRLNGKVRWDALGMRGPIRAYINATKSKGSGYMDVSGADFCKDAGEAFSGGISEAAMDLSFDWAEADYTVQGLLHIPKSGGLLITSPLRIHEGALSYRGRGQLRFPASFALVGGDTVKHGEVHLEVDPTNPDRSVALGWTPIGDSTAGLRVDLEDGKIAPFAKDTELARRARMAPTPDFAPADGKREEKISAARMVDDPQVNMLRKRARGPDARVQYIAYDIRELVVPKGRTVVRLRVHGVPKPSRRLQTAWDMLKFYYTTPARYDFALSKTTSNFARPIYGPPQMASPYLWGTKALRLKTRTDGLGLTPAAVPSTIWGAWGLRSNLGCAGRFGAKGYFGARDPGEPVEGAEKRAFCWLGTRAHLESRVDDVFSYPVGKTALGGVTNEKLGTQSVKRPYKYNMMPGLSLKTCPADRAPGTLDCDPYLADRGLSCDEQQAYIGATRIGSCAPVLHEYRPLTIDGKVVEFDAPQSYGTLRAEFRTASQSKDGSVDLRAGANPLIQCPAEVTVAALSQRTQRGTCHHPGQVCRAFVDSNSGGVPSLGPAFECVAGQWKSVGLSPLEASGFPRACHGGGGWKATVERKGDKFIGTDTVQTQVTSTCILVGSEERFRGIGWGWWGEISDPYCASGPKGAKPGTAGGPAVAGALPQRAFQACSYPWEVAKATRDWEAQLAGCLNPPTSLTGPDFGECRFEKSLGLPVRLVAWDKSGTLYQWEPLDLEQAQSAQKAPRGLRYSYSYDFAGAVAPGSYSEEARTIVEGAAQCRDLCDSLGSDCLGYTLGLDQEGRSCHLATRSAFRNGLSKSDLKPAPKASTYLKHLAALFPTVYAGDTTRCGRSMGRKNRCSQRSVHTFVLSPTLHSIGDARASLSARTVGERAEGLRHLLKQAHLMLDPSDRNREGLRVVAVSNRRLAATNGATHAKGKHPQLPKDFAFQLSTQPSRQTPTLQATVSVDPKTHTVTVKMRTPEGLRKQTKVRIYVDSDRRGFDGRVIYEGTLDKEDSVQATWDRKAFGKDPHQAYFFYAMAFDEDSAGHRLAPPVLSAYGEASLSASPAISGSVALGEEGKSGRCVHVASRGETCSSIALGYGLKAGELRQKDGKAGCENARLGAGTVLSFPGSCGVRVFIDQNADGQLQSSEPESVTDHQGRFAFYGVKPNKAVHIAFILPEGFHSREDFRTSFGAAPGNILAGASSQKTAPGGGLQACLDACDRPTGGEGLLGDRRAIRADLKECGGITFEASGPGGLCTLHITDADKRTLKASGKAGKATLYVRYKRHNRMIHRLIQVNDRPVSLPRVILHPQ